MAQQNIVIVNTGCANISSLKFALERLGVAVTVSDDPATISRADKVFLPGVGNAMAAMKSIKTKQLATALKALKQPVLGVCLGMQLMVESSAESSAGTIDCLHLMPGKVERLRAGNLRLPHMGWNTLTQVQPSPLFTGIDVGTYFYFVHSFAVPVYTQTLAACEYGQAFSAAIQHNNFFGVQFHPERSGEAGSQLLTNFVNM